MLNMNTLLLFSDDPKKLSGFYTKVLDREPDWSGGGFVGFRLGDNNLLIGPHDKVHGKNKAPERMMFNLDTEEFGMEYNRIKALGVPIVQEPYNPGEDDTFTIATFADPDGNFFQLTTQLSEA